MDLDITRIDGAQLKSLLKYTFSLFKIDYDCLFARLHQILIMRWDGGAIGNGVQRVRSSEGNHRHLRKDHESGIVQHVRMHPHRVCERFR